MLAGRRQGHRMAGVDRRFHLRGAGRLDADDLHVRPRLLDRRGDARDEPAAADGHDHRRDVGHCSRISSPPSPVRR